jgi:hypothetical protein
MWRVGRTNRDGLGGNNGVLYFEIGNHGDL